MVFISILSITNLNQQVGGATVRSPDITDMTRDAFMQQTPSAQKSLIENLKTKYLGLELPDYVYSYPNTSWRLDCCKDRCYMTDRNKKHLRNILAGNFPSKFKLDTDYIQLDKNGKKFEMITVKDGVKQKTYDLFPDRLDQCIDDRVKYLLMPWWWVKDTSQWPHPTSLSHQQPGEGRTPPPR